MLITCTLLRQSWIDSSVIQYSKSSKAVPSATVDRTRDGGLRSVARRDEVVFFFYRETDSRNKFLVFQPGSLQNEL